MRAEKLMPNLFGHAYMQFLKIALTTLPTPS